MLKFNKKVITGTIIAVAILLVGFVTVAYTSGKATAEKPVVDWVSHTEYWRNDNASSIIRITNYKGDPYAVDECKITILKPDKSVFVDAQPMAESNIPGNWYRTDSLIDAPLGTYEQEVTCTKNNQLVTKTSQSFHLNAALEQINTLTGMVDTLTTNLSDVNVQITGQIAETGQTIQTNISGMNTNLTTILNDLNTQMINQFSETNSSLITQLSNVNISLTGLIETTGQEINTNLSDVNTSLSNLIETEVVNGLSTQMDEMLADLTNQLNNVRSDTNWLVLNAMNQDNADEINARFTNVDQNLNAILNMCSTDTNSNELCTELYNIESVMRTLNDEQNGYIETINNTTTNTWELLSGDIATNIDSLLTDVGIIKAQTTDINATTHQILDEMQSEVRGSIIS